MQAIEPLLHTESLRGDSKRCLVFDLIVLFNRADGGMYYASTLKPLIVHIQLDLNF